MENKPAGIVICAFLFVLSGASITFLMLFFYWFTFSGGGPPATAWDIVTLVFSFDVGVV